MCSLSERAGADADAPGLTDVCFPPPAGQCRCWAGSLCVDFADAVAQISPSLPPSLRFVTTAVRKGGGGGVWGGMAASCWDRHDPELSWRSGGRVMLMAARQRKRRIRWPLPRLRYVTAALEAQKQPRSG